MQHFTYKYWSTTQTKVGGQFWQHEKRGRATLNLSHLLQAAGQPPFFLANNTGPPLFLIFFTPSQRPPQGHFPSASLHLTVFSLNRPLRPHTPISFSQQDHSHRSLPPAGISFLSSRQQGTAPSLSKPNRGSPPPFPLIFNNSRSSSLPQSSLIFPDQRTGRAVPHLLRPTAPASASRSFLPQPPNSLQRQQQPTGQQTPLTASSSDTTPSSVPPCRAAHGTEEKKKMTEGDRSAVKQIQKNRMNQIWEGEERTKIDCFVAFWLFLQVTAGLGRQRGRRHYRSLVFWSFRRRHVNPRAATVPAALFRLAEVLPCNFWSFRDHFCNF